MTPRKFFTLVESHCRAEGVDGYEEKHAKKNAGSLTLEELKSWQTG